MNVAKNKSDFKTFGVFQGMSIMSVNNLVHVHDFDMISLGIVPSIFPGWYTGTDSCGNLQVASMCG